MAGNKVTLTFAGDADQLSKAAKQAETATQGVTDKVASASKDTRDYGDRLAKVGAAASGFSAAIDDAGQSVQALVDFQNRGRERAMAQARALQDVQHAMDDASQAAGDL